MHLFGTPVNLDQRPSEALSLEKFHEADTLHYLANFPVVVAVEKKVLAGAGPVEGTYGAFKAFFAEIIGLEPGTRR
jgi:hypothetical protein